MSKALVEILGNAASYLRSLRQSGDATAGFEGDLKKLAITAQKTARAQIDASVRKDARMREEIRYYKEVAATAKRGSREQIVAANLATSAEHRLARSLGVSAHEARRLSLNAGRAERDMAGLSRGAALGSGAFHGLGRSLLYASSFMLGGFGIVSALKATVAASIEEKTQMAQLATAANDAGVSFKGHKGQLDAVLASQRKLGFAQSDSIAQLANEVRATRSVSDARSALSLADDISRGRHIALSAAGNAVARAYGGQTGALRRLLPFIGKGASATEALQQAQRAYAGSAEKYARGEAGTQARLNVALHATAVTIGNELAPTVSSLQGKLAKWLDNSKHQARVQRDVKVAVHDVKVAAHELFGLLKDGVAIVKRVDGVTGSFKNTLELTAGVMVALKFARVTNGLLKIAGEAGGASGMVGKLRRGLLGINGLAVVATIEIIVLKKFANSVLGIQRQTLAAEANAPFAKGLVPKIAGEIAQRERAGQSPMAINSAIYAMNGGQGAAQEKLLAEAYKYLAYQQGKGPEPAWMKVPKKLRAHAGAALSQTSAADAAMGANQLALAAAKTDSEKLRALVDERQLLETRMAADRKGLLSATGATRDLLNADLLSLTKKDTAAFNQIARIQKHEAAVVAAAARKAAAAARAAARAYLEGVRTTAEGLLSAADGAKTAGSIRKTYGALVAFYRREAADTHLTALARARYAKAAIDEQNRMAKAIVRERKAAAKALETRQLGSLGIGAGQSISDLLQRVKDAATAKEEGLPGVGVGPPSVRMLKGEADQVAKALKGTYLDTNVSRNVISKIRTLLSGQLGGLNATMRNKIQQLLQGLRNDMKSFDGFNLAAADKHRRFLDKRFADRYGTGVADGRRLPTLRGSGLGRMTTGSVSRQTIHYHFEPHLQVIANEPIGHALDRSFFRQRHALGALR